MGSETTPPQGSHIEEISRDGRAAHPFVRDFEPYLYGRPVTYVDVGAHVGGVFGQLLTSSIRVREAHLIEPNPQSFGQLRAAVEEISDVDRIACHNVALSAVPGEVVMRDDGTMTRIIDHPSGESEESGLDAGHFRIPTTTLDELARSCDIGHINLLKVDVEGHELQVLDGAKELLAAAAVDVIYIEVGMDPSSHQQSYYRAVEDVLRGYGYQLSKVYEQRNEWPTDGLALRRANVAFISTPFADRNPAKVTRELFRLRRRHEELTAEVERLRAAEKERAAADENIHAAHERLKRDHATAVARVAELERRAAQHEAKLKETEKREKTQVAALTGERDAYAAYADELEAKYRSVLRSHSWRLTGPVRVATRTFRRLLGRPVSGRNRLPKRPRPASGRAVVRGGDAGPVATQCTAIMRMLKESDFPALYRTRRDLEGQLATPDGFLVHAFLVITLARKTSAFAFGAQAADAVLRRFASGAGSGDGSGDGEGGDGGTFDAADVAELAARLGEQACRRFGADAAVDYTRVGRYGQARAVLDAAILAGHAELMPTRAEISWIHDPELAVRDLEASAELPLSRTEARKNALLRRHVVVNVLGRDAEPDTEWSGGEFALVDAVRALDDGRHGDYRRLVDEFFSEQGLYPPLARTDEPFSFAALGVGGEAEPAPEGPLVSVIMTTFNAADTVEYAVRSILEQTHSQLELLIVDDVSTDGTPAVLNELAAADERIVVIHAERNGGTYAGRNRALRQARGTYITFHDADDWAHPQRLRVHVEAMEDDPAVLATRSMWLRVDSTGRIDFRRWHRRLVHPNPASMFFRREVVDRIGFFDPVRFSADSEYWYRAQRVFGRTAVRGLPTCLGFGRQHDSSLTRSGAGARDAEDYSPVRSAYQHSWFEWHARSSAGDLWLDGEPGHRRFWAPPQMQETAPVAADSSRSPATLAVAYPGLDGEQDPPAMIFGISLASKQAAADWALTERLLARTLRSVLNQEDPRWRAVVCGHDRPDLPELDDPRVIFMTADIEPPADSRGFRKDKMWKRRLAATVLRDLGGGYFCPLDADDLIHTSLVARVLADDNRRGYGIERGYVEDFTNERLAPVPGVWSAPFDRVCGSSAVLYFDADELPRDGKADPELYFNLFQAHAYWPIVAEELGRPLERLPFAAGVYVVNHSQNLSFGLQRAGRRTANVIAAIERQAVSDREEVLRAEFGQV